MVTVKEVTAAAGEIEAGSNSKMIILVSKEGTTFEVSVVGARLSTVLKEKLDGEGSTSDGVQQLPVDVGAAALEKVVAYLKKHAEAEAASDDDDEEGRTATVARCKAVRTRAVEDLEKWDADLVEGVASGSRGQGALLYLALAAYKLRIDGLLDAGCKRIADTMGQTAEQIRSLFHILDDFTPQEKEEVSDEYDWTFPKRPNGGGSLDAATTDSGDDDDNDGGDGDGGEEAKQNGEDEEKEATGSNSKMIILKSKEDNTFEVSSVLEGKLDGEGSTSDLVEGVVNGSGYDALLNLVLAADDDDGRTATVPRRKAVRARAVEDLEKWDADLVEGVVSGSGHDALLNLVLGVGDLDIDGLHNPGCKRIGDMMRYEEQIRRVLDITKDLTPQEEEEVRKEWAWAFPKCPIGDGSTDAAADDGDCGDGDGGDKIDEQDHEEEDEHEP